MSWIHLPKQHQIHSVMKFQGQTAATISDISLMTTFPCCYAMLICFRSITLTLLLLVKKQITFCYDVLMSFQGINKSISAETTLHRKQIEEFILSTYGAGRPWSKRQQQQAVLVGWGNVLCGQSSLKVGKGAAHTPGMGRKKEAGEWQTQQEEVLEEIVKRSSLQPHRLQDVTWEHSVP